MWLSKIRAVLKTFAECLLILLNLSLPILNNPLLEHRLDIDVILRRYCEDYSSTESRGLNEIERQTHLHTVKRLDASDTIQGRLISFISHLIRPELIVEIGTFTGYATGCLSEGLAPNGRIISIEQNDLFKDMIERNLESLGISDRVDMKYGDALTILPTIDSEIDLIFIDAAKYEYEAYFDLTIDQLRSGGVILADNVLWKGRVLERNKDKMTTAMHKFNVKIKNDQRVEVVILPYRDGISLIRKK